MYSIICQGQGPGFRGQAWGSVSLSDILLLVDVKYDVVTQLLYKEMLQEYYSKRRTAYLLSHYNTDNSLMTKDCFGGGGSSEHLGVHAAMATAKGGGRSRRFGRGCSGVGRHGLFG